MTDIAVMDAWETGSLEEKEVKELPGEDKEHRPLLYETKGKRTRRRRTETDIHLAEIFLNSENTFYQDKLLSGSLLSTHASSVKNDGHSKRRTVRRTKDRQRRQTVAADGIYYARRAVSVEQLPVSDDSSSVGSEKDEKDADKDIDTCSEDEFFLATEFVSSLPKTNHTQSVDFLDSIVREDEDPLEQVQRRCTSEYDIFDTQARDYQTTSLQKDISLHSSSSSYIDFAFDGQHPGSKRELFGSDLESLPPESLDGSLADDLCPSPLGFGDIDDWTPPHDPNVIHSAREYRDFSRQRELTQYSEGKRCKSETFLLERRARSLSMLSDEVYMDDIECHHSFRRKLRTALGLEDTSSAATSINTSTDNTSLSFRLPHTKTNEPLHARLRRVLSSVSINESLSEDDADTNTRSTRNFYKRRQKRAHSRTKSMPLNVKEFIQSYNSNSNNNSQYYERSKSAEVLNHLGEKSAFSIYNEDGDEESSVLDLDAEYEIFIDSPLTVDYQLGRRQSLPASSSPSDLDRHDREITEVLAESYQVVRAEPVVVGTPDVRDSVVHATPIQIGTPCQTTSVELSMPLSPLVIHQEDVIGNSTNDAEMSGRRQPMRTFSFTSKYSEDAPLGSPHDSLATDADNIRGGTGYFLRFDDVDHKITSSKKQPTVKSKPSTPSPKKPKMSTKTPPPVSKKPTSPIKKTNTAVSKPVRSPTNKMAPASKVSSSPTVKANHKPTVSSALYKPTISSALKATPAITKKQPPPVKPKPVAKGKSKIPVKETVKTAATRGRTAAKVQNDGFRTRSVSPKVLKREDEVAKDKLLNSVAGQCDKLLKNVQTDREHFTEVMHSRKSMSTSTSPEPVSEESIGTNSNHSFLGQSDARPIANDEDKSANIYSNNNQWERIDTPTERPSKLVGSEDSIDLAVNNQPDNTRVDCQPPLVEDIQVRLAEETLISPVESDKSDKAELTEDTVPLFSERDSVSELCPINDSFYQSEPGCQELGELTNSREKNLTGALTPDEKNETERDTSIDHGASIIGVTTHSTWLQGYEVAEPLERQQEQLENKREATTTTMASSWMDRLKEDLDNDDEWLSDEEEFQREQEAQIRAAAQQKALAEEESLSDDEHPPPIPRGQGHNEPERDSGSDWSDEEVGFQRRNDPLRKSMNRNNYSADEYSTDEEVAMLGRTHRQEPNQEEMDLMVKKNLAYVNSKELDQMDILTSDLDVPSEQLELQAGVGEMVRPDESGAFYSLEPASAAGFDAKEDSDGENHIEVVGTLEVVGDSDILPEHRDVNKWSDSNIADYTSKREADHSFDDEDREATRSEFISALAEELKDSDRQEMSGKASPGGNYADEDLVNPSNNSELEAQRIQDYLDHTEHIDQDEDEHNGRSSPQGDYDTQVIRPGRNRGWRKQLSQKMNEWEEELPSPGRPNAAGFESRDEAVTSFMSEEDEEKDDVDHASPMSDKSKPTEDELREKVEGSMKDKIRDWKNMTAESASGQVDEWQSLGNFNVPNEQSRRRVYEDADDEDVPAEKRRDKLPTSQARQDSGDYADINTMVHHSTSYDGDAEGDDIGDSGAMDSDGGEDDGDGYVSDSSSQDTVRERSMQRQTQIGSVSDEDGAVDEPSVNEPAADPTQEPGYVEILGGEEPPDEWMNLGIRRERISSSSSDGSGFEYIAGGHQYSQEPANVDSADDEDSAVVQIPALITRSSRERMATPPLDLPVTTHPAVEDVMHEMEYTERQSTTPPTMTEEPSPVEEIKAMDVETVEVAEEPMSPTAGEEILTEDEVEAAPEDVNEQLSSPEPAAEDPPVETRSITSSSSSASEADEPAVPEKAPEPTTRTDSFDRVEKLREEMRSAANSGQSQSFDLQTTRQSRSTDRFTERMKSLEKTKALREKKTAAPVGLSGKFSSVFSRFETSDDLPKRKPKVVQIGRSKSMGPSTRRREEKAAEPVEPIKSSNSKQTKTNHEVKQAEKLQTKETRKPETKEQQPAKAEPKAKRIERSKTFDTGIPGRSPSGSKVLERMARLGLSMEIPMDQQRTVTTKNQDTERFERHTVEGRDKVKVEQLNKKRQPTEEKRDEYLNVWDTEVPVTDSNRKILSSQRLHVSSVSKEIKTSSAQDNEAERPLSRSTSEPRLRRKAPTLKTEEISITVRPQHSTNKSSRNSRRPDSQGDKEEQGRMRSSIALQPTDEVIQAKQAARQHGSAPRQRSPSPRKYHERDLPLKKADSLDELRTGQLVAQCKGLFSNEETNPEKYMPANQHKSYPNRKSEQFVRGSSEQSWDNRRRERQDMMSDAVREFADAYDQMDDDYNVGYSRESLEYTRKWIENNETTPPSDIPMHQNGDYERERIADPVRDDAAFRRMQQANRSLPKHLTTGSSASPDTSVIGDRGRARSTDRGEVRQVRTGRPKGRSRSLPRRKPAKAIADRASLFSNPSDEQVVYRQDIDDHIRSASTGRHLQNSNRRSASPRTVTQKERLANRRSMPAQQREPTEAEQGSPRAASKGVAMMVELYNKSKGGDSALADVDEQTLASVDDAMFRQRGGPVTSPSVEDGPQSRNAWKAWHGHHEKSSLEQKVENAYHRHTQQAGPPIKRDNKPAVNSGWQQRSTHEERMVIPTNASRSYNAAPQPSPPRPVKSDVAMDMQRRGWSTSPPAPAVPQRGYMADPGHPGMYNNGHAPDAAFDNYKQQTLQKFKQEEQYATVQRSSRPEPPRQLPLNAPNNFDQALLMQAPPPKPERLYNRVEPWEAYPPNEYPTTNSLQGYPAKPTPHYPSDSRGPARYPEERQQYQGYPPERQASQREHRQRDYPPPQQRQSYPVPHTRYDERGYPTQQPQQQQYREPSYSSQPKQNYPQQSYREPSYDGRSYGPPGDPYSNGYADQRRSEHARPDQADSYRQTPRKEGRYPHEQPPRGPIPDPRYGMRSPPPQQADPRYGAYDPKMESAHQPPRRTNSVPNIKQHVISPSKSQPPQSYNPRYNDQYVDDRQRAPQPYNNSGSLSRSGKQKDKSKKKSKNKTDLPEFTPIQYATGKMPPKNPAQNGYGHSKQPLNNNYPPAANNNRYVHPADQGYSPHGYSSNGHGYPPSGQSYPSGGYPPHGHPVYPHDDPYNSQKTRPGVGIIYNPDLGISDF